MIPEFPTFGSFLVFLGTFALCMALLIGLSFLLEIALGLDLGILAWSTR